MDIYIWHYIRNANKRRQRRRHRENLLELRTNSKPFDLPDTRFIQLFRLNKANTEMLKNQLLPYTTASLIPFEIQLLTTLHFYGYGSYQASIGSNNLFGLSQPSTSRAIETTTNIINQRLVRDTIKFPSTILETAEKKRCFHLKYNMPNIIGVVDGTHIPILAPAENNTDAPGHLYMNRKGYPSLNVLVISDANLKIIFADARFTGSVHDSAIWMVSPVRKLLARNFTTPENQNSYIIGDSGLPLEPWLLIPFHNPVGTREEMFQKRFLKARNSVERAFGVVKNRFRCLSRHRVLHYAPEKAAKIIYACFALNNIYTMGPEHFIEENLEPDENENVEPNVDRNRNEWHSIGTRVRERYVSNLI